MTFANQPHPDERATRDPPVHPMPPAPDLQFVVPPTDPIGMPQQPVPSQDSIRRDGKKPSRVGLLIVAGTVLLIIGGITLLIWLGS